MPDKLWNAAKVKDKGKRQIGLMVKSRALRCIMYMNMNCAELHERSRNISHWAAPRYPCSTAGREWRRRRKMKVGWGREEKYNHGTERTREEAQTYLPNDAPATGRSNKY